MMNTDQNAHESILDVAQIPEREAAIIQLPLYKSTLDDSIHQSVEAPKRMIRERVRRCLYHISQHQDARLSRLRSWPRVAEKLFSHATPILFLRFLVKIPNQGCAMMLLN